MSFARLVRSRDGQYLGPDAGDGSPRSNRGEEIGVFQDEFLVVGGRLRYSARENVVNPGSFQFCRLESAVSAQGSETLCAGRIPRRGTGNTCSPWMALYPARYCRTDDVAGSLRQGPRSAPRSVAVEGIPPDSDVVALALGHGAGLAAYRMAQPGSWARWRICLIALPRRP